MRISPPSQYGAQVTEVNSQCQVNYQLHAPVLWKTDFGLDIGLRGKYRRGDASGTEEPGAHRSALRLFSPWHSKERPGVLCYWACRFSVFSVDSCRHNPPPCSENWATVSCANAARERLLDLNCGSRQLIRNAHAKFPQSPKTDGVQIMFTYICCRCTNCAAEFALEDRADSDTS